MQLATLVLKLLVVLTTAILGKAGTVLRGSVVLDDATQEAAKAGNLSFPAYVAAFNRQYAEGSDEYQKRQQIYEEVAKEVRAHSQLPNRRWQMAINHLSDRTPGELAKLRGRKGRWGGAPSAPTGSSLMGAHSTMVRISSDGTPVWEAENLEESALGVKEAVDWTHLQSLQEVHDQGACGSCWALATVSLLAARYEVANHGATRTFSPQELVDCTPNPKDCGGEGGCEGATMELGLEYVRQHGLATEEAVPYLAKITEKDHCPKTSLFESLGLKATGAGDTGGGMKVGLRSWAKLPENKQEPLMRALADGPVGVSVGAGKWQSYFSGVFDACDKDVVIDHAVLLVGYGEDIAQGKYWKIRNSWTKSWGEEGNIRLARLDGDAGAAGHCGSDTDPKQGTACKPYPESVPVCGMCGVLYDSVTADFIQGKGHDGASITQAVPAQSKTVRSHKPAQTWDGLEKAIKDVEDKAKKIDAGIDHELAEEQLSEGKGSDE